MEGGGKKKKNIAENHLVKFPLFFQNNIYILLSLSFLLFPKGGGGGKKEF